MATCLILLAWAVGLVLFDWRRRLLPNWLLLNGILVGTIHWAATGAMPFGVSLAEGALTMVLAVALLWPIYRMGWMGAGDVKLCAVIGWLAGAEVAAWVFLVGSALGGLFALALLTPGLANRLSAPGLEGRLARRIPFGAALAVVFAGWTVDRMVPGWFS